MDEELGPEFELDFCTAMNMMLGKSYEEAVEEARKWVHDGNNQEKKCSQSNKSNKC